MKIREFYKRREGQSLVEFALILPILLAIILGTVEFGWIFFAKLTTNNSAREVARQVTVAELSDTEATSIAETVLPNQFTGVSVTVAPNKTTKPYDVKATVEIDVTPLVGLFIKDPVVNVKSTSVMRIEYKVP